MLYRQLRHGPGARIRRAQLPLALQLVWRWVLWCEQPVRPAESHSCSATTARPTCFHSRRSTYGLGGRELGAHRQFPAWLCAHLVMHICPCNRMWSREWFSIYHSTSSGSCGNGLCHGPRHGPRLQGSVIIGGYWYLPSVTLLIVNYWTDFGHRATKAVVCRKCGSDYLQMVGPWDSCPPFSKVLSNFSYNEQAVCVF